MLCHSVICQISITKVCAKFVLDLISMLFVDGDNEVDDFSDSYDDPYVCLCVAKDVYVHVQCTLYVHNMNYMYDDAVDDADDADDAVQQ